LSALADERHAPAVASYPAAIGSKLSVGPYCQRYCRRDLSSLVCNRRGRQRRAGGNGFTR
jgi:hypothetical protein